MNAPETNFPETIRYPNSDCTSSVNQIQRDTQSASGNVSS